MTNFTETAFFHMSIETYAKYLSFQNEPAIREALNIIRTQFEEADAIQYLDFMEAAPVNFEGPQNWKDLVDLVYLYLNA